MSTDLPPAVSVHTESRSDGERDAWHALPHREVLESLASDEGGLSGEEAERRLEQYGENSLEVAKPVSGWKILADQLRSLVVVLLSAAAGVALLIGDVLEAAAIAAVLVINTIVGFWTEWRARRAMAALSQLQVQEAEVVRSGESTRVDARYLVPGDVIQLSAGTAVPADARVLKSTELRVIEAPLTGESLPVTKRSEPVFAPAGEGIALADRTSMIYKGTLVAAGSGRAVVVGTGASTEIGRVSALVQETESERTPLERWLDALGRRLVWITLGVAAIVTGLGVLRGEALWLMVQTGIALAIAAVPEGLPVVATITLAVGMRRMAKRHALVRRLPAVETLGSATVICTDKTGTLTAGEMTVTALAVAGTNIEVSGAGYAPDGAFQSDGATLNPSEVPALDLALRIGVLVNRADVKREDDGWVAEGAPTEAALLVAGAKAGLMRDEILADYPELAEVPFSSERKLMATFHKTPAGRIVAYVKGAPRRIVDLSTSALGAAGLSEVRAPDRERLLEVNRGLARNGLRVLALGYRELEEDEQPGEGVLDGLTLVGFAGLADPPAEGVKETIERFRGAGVRTVMITGDQAITAQAVASDLGVLEDDDETVTGGMMIRISADELSERVDRIGAFSRVSPEDKLRIVEAYQKRGEIVGMLGDGVNDAAALKRADIGVAMGRRGTDVAKETADVVLQDDRFETIGSAVEEGRVIFDNVRKVIFYLFSCNASEVLVLFIAGLAGLPLPLLPLQILWLNLITDVFPALALAMEPAEPGVMDRPPRDPKSAVLSRPFVLGVSGYAVLITAVTLGVFVWGLNIREVEVGHAVTLAFMTLALTQIFHVFNARSIEPIVFSRQFFKNAYVWSALGVTLALQFLAVYLPGLSGVLRTTPLGLEDWGVVLAASLFPLVFGQTKKRIEQILEKRSEDDWPLEAVN